VHADDDGGDDAKGAPAATPQRPEEIGVLIRGGGNETAVGSDNLERHDVVCGHAVEAGKGRVAAACDVAASVSHTLSTVS